MKRGRGAAALAPIGKPSRVPFASIKRVGVQADDPLVLVVQCLEREHYFRFATAPLCEEWAAALCAAGSG